MGQELAVQGSDPTYPHDAIEMISVLWVHKPMTPAEYTLFVRVFSTMAPQIGRRVADAFAMGEIVPRRGKAMPPLPVEITDAALREQCPLPDPHAAWGEVKEKIEKFGRCGRVKDPARPRILTEGAPPFSHPVITLTIQRIGGWLALCDGELGHGSYLITEFIKCFQETVEQYAQELRRQVALPAAEQDRRLLAPRQAYFTLGAALAEEECHEAQGERLLIPALPDMDDLRAAVSKAPLVQKSREEIEALLSQSVVKDVPKEEVKKPRPCADAPSVEELARRRALLRQGRAALSDPEEAKRAEQVMAEMLRRSEEEEAARCGRPRLSDLFTISPIE